LLEGEQQLAALESEWTGLLADSQAHPVTLSHLWLSTWWHVFGADRQLRVLLIRDDLDRLLGIAPLLRRATAYKGIVPYVRLELLGTGEAEEDEIDSDCLDFVVRRGFEANFCQHVLEFLQERDRADWQELILGPLPAESPTLAVAHDWGRRAGWDVEEIARRPGSCVHLPRTWGEMLAQVSVKMRANIRRDRRRLERVGKVSFAWTRGREDFERAWPVLVRLHQRRWQHQGRPGCFASRKFTAFHESVGPRLAEKGQARIATLSVDGQVLAARYLFVAGRTVYAYQSGWEPTLDRRLAVGRALLGFAIEAAIAEQFECYDFLKGIGAHKLAWAPRIYDQVTVRLARRGWREPLRAGLAWASDRARALRGPRRIKFTPPS